MKNQVLILLSVLFFMQLGVAQKKDKIKGNRILAEVSDDLPPFDAIELQDDIEVVLKKSINEGYVIIADDNLIDIIRFDVIEGTLIISTDLQVTTKKALEISINFVELKSIIVKSGKLIVDDEISTDILYVNTFGNSDLILKADTFKLNLAMENSSKADLKVDADSLNIFQRDKSSAFIYAMSGAHNIELRDNADLSMEGSTADMEIEAYGHSKLKAPKLEASIINLKVDEDAVARIQANRKLNLNASGDTKIYLYGDPEIVISQFINTPQLIKKELN